MRLRRVGTSLLMGLVLWVGCACAAMASAYHGQVTFSGLPLPGSVVSVTATQGDKKAVAVSDDQGLFSFADLADGKWELDIEMTGFAPLKQEITVAPNTPLATFEMKLMTLDQIRAADKPVKVDATAPAVASVAAPAAGTPAAGASATAGKNAAAPAAKGGAKTAAAAGGPAAPAAAEAPGGAAASQDATSAQANDGFLVNGSVNNAATSQFSLNQAFGNNRNGGRWLYNGGLSLVLQNSDLNAKNFSINGEDSPKPPYTDIVAGAQLGGPLKIPHFLPASRAPYFQFGYQRTEDKNDTINPVLMPTAAEVGGNLSGAPNVTSIYVPADLATSAPACNSYLLGTGVTQAQINSGTQVFVGNIIPQACISQQAQYLLKFYPLPNSSSGSQFNYQVPLASDTHTDAYRLTLQKQLGSKNNLNGNMTVQDTRSSTPSIFGFLDTGGTLNTGVNAGWYHRFTQRLSMNAGYSFSAVAEHQHVVFCQQDERGGDGRDCGQRYEPGLSELLWASGAGVLERAGGLVGWIELEQPAGDEFGFVLHDMEPFPSQYDVRRGFSQAGIQLPDGIEPARLALLQRRADGEQRGDGQRIGFCGFSAGIAGHQRDCVWQRGQVSAAECV